MAELHEIMFALDAHRTAHRLESMPQNDMPFLALFPLWRILLGIALLGLNVWVWRLILAG